MNSAKTVLPSFSWDELATFLRDLIGCEEDQIDSYDAPNGHVQSLQHLQNPFIGSFTFFTFRSGLVAAAVDGTATSDLDFAVIDGNRIRFNFALSIDHSLGGVSRANVDVTSPSWRVIDHPREKVTRESIRSNTVAQWLTIACKIDFIQHLSGRAEDDLPELFRLPKPNQYNKTRYQDFDLHSRFSSITFDILKSRIDDPIHLAYIEARCVELLCLALKDLLDPIDTDGQPVMTERETEQILYAKAYIDERINTPPSIREISTAAGLNRNSLFYGFKRKFGVSVSEYIKTRRLEHAKFLIEHTNRRLIEISEAVGFRHQSSFITAFRKQFGVTPGKIRRLNGR